MNFLSICRSVKGQSEIVFSVCMICAASALLSCGSDSDGDEFLPDGNSGDAVSHALKYRLAKMELDGKNRFSDAQYDQDGRLTAYVGGWSYNYHFGYESDKITFGSAEDAEDGVSRVLENGRIVSCGKVQYEYDTQGRLAKVLHNGLNGGGWENAIIEWEDGNIKTVTIDTYAKDGTLASPQLYRYEYVYSPIECKSVLMYMKDRADRIPSPFDLLYDVDMILVAEGYFGNTSLKNLVIQTKFYRSNESNSYDVNVSWKMNDDGLPVEAVSTQPGYRHVWTMSWE